MACAEGDRVDQVKHALINSVFGERAEGLRDVPGPAGERVAPTVLWRVPTGGN